MVFLPDRQKPRGFSAGQAEGKGGGGRLLWWAKGGGKCHSGEWELHGRLPRLLRTRHPRTSTCTSLVPARPCSHAQRTGTEGAVSAGGAAVAGEGLGQVVAEVGSHVDNTDGEEQADGDACVARCGGQGGRGWGTEQARFVREPGPGQTAVLPLTAAPAAKPARSWQQGGGGAGEQAAGHNWARAPEADTVPGAVPAPCWGAPARAALHAHPALGR